MNSILGVLILVLPATLDVAFTTSKYRCDEFDPWCHSVRSDVTTVTVNGNTLM